MNQAMKKHAAIAEKKGWFAATDGDPMSGGSHLHKQGKVKKEGLFESARKNGWFAMSGGNPMTDAFQAKKSVHAGMSGLLVSAEKMPDILEQLRSKERQEPLAAAYVHLPYCESKCLYCGFFGGKYTQEGGASYLDTLLREIENDNRTPAMKGAPIRALYLGGGTPTALTAQELSTLLKTLRSVLPLANDCEITVEGRIHNFGDEKMEACLAAGANRFSLGVQSFNTKLRRQLGRIDTKEKVMERLTRLASYNQAAIVVDLIYGLPGQTIADWTDDIQTFLDLPLDGVDLYHLNVFPGSALERAIAEGRLPQAAPIAEQVSFFKAGIELMEQARARRLSISHWGVGTRERNFYNPMAKNRADCLNFGVRSGGALHGYFLANDASVESYTSRVVKGEKPVSMMMEPPATLSLVKSILGQMELCRLHMPSLSDALAQSPLSAAYSSSEALFGPLLENWEKAGLVKCDGEWRELSLAGQFWQVNMTHALLGWQHIAFLEQAS